MRPILFKVFGISIYGYGTMIAIGICAALILVSYRAKKRGYDEDSVLNMSIIAIISGILGGKLLYIITDIKSIIADPSLLKDVGSGFVIYGAIIGGALGVVFYCLRKKWTISKVFDMVIPSIALAQGFGRIGCFLAGCCYGKETHLTIGVQFKNSPFAPAGETLQPTQIYSSIFDFALAAFLLWYGRKKRKDGRVFSMYVIIYSIGRFLVEFLRNDPRGNIGALSTSQFISIFTLIFGIVYFNIDKFKKNVPVQAAEAADLEERVITELEEVPEEEIPAEEYVQGEGEEKAISDTEVIEAKEETSDEGTLEEKTETSDDKKEDTAI
jgi:phosphatidylglycerol:prolipoprotein diacylglycerol transferase